MTMENQEIKAEASMVECNHGGIEIGNITSESLWWRRNWGEDSITEWKEAEINYATQDNDGNSFNDEDITEEDYHVEKPYFIIGNVDDKGKEWMYFLDEFMCYDR